MIDSIKSNDKWVMVNDMNDNKQQIYEWWQMASKWYITNILLGSPIHNNDFQRDPKSDSKWQLSDNKWQMIDGKLWQMSNGS